MVNWRIWRAFDLQNSPKLSPSNLLWRSDLTGIMPIIARNKTRLNKLSCVRLTLRWSLYRNFGETHSGFRTSQMPFSLFKLFTRWLLGGEQRGPVLARRTLQRLLANPDALTVCQQREAEVNATRLIRHLDWFKAVTNARTDTQITERQDMRRRIGRIESK